MMHVMCAILGNFHKLSYQVVVHCQNTFNSTSLLTYLFAHLLGAVVRPRYDPCH